MSYTPQTTPRIPLVISRAEKGLIQDLVASSVFSPVYLFVLHTQSKNVLLVESIPFNPRLLARTRGYSSSNGECRVTSPFPLGVEDAFSHRDHHGERTLSTYFTRETYWKRRRGFLLTPLAHLFLILLLRF